MKIQNSRHRLFSLIFFLLLPSIDLLAQGTPYTVGPLTVTIPAGWNAKAAFTGERERFFSPESAGVQFFAVGFSSSESGDDVLTHHNSVIKNLSGIIAPGTNPESGTLGQFVWTRIVIQRPIPGSKPETLILYSTKLGSTYVSIDVDATTEDLLARDLPQIEAMIRAATISTGGARSGSASTGSIANVTGNAARAHSRSLPGQPSSSAQPAATPAQMPTGPATLGEYVYSMPAGWAPKQYPGSMTLFSPVSSTGEQCQITMWPLRPAGANLINDAAVAFQQVFDGFEPRSQTSYGPLNSSLIRGTNGAGWNYVIVKQGIGRHGPYEALMGSVMAARLNNAVAVVSTLSKDPLVSTCLGESIADAWPDFFYSLSFKSWVPPAEQATVMKQGLVGTWTAASSTASDQFTFAANGRYGGASAAQHYNVLANDTVLTTTQGFFGDGVYSLQGNTITFTPDDRNRPRNSGYFRLEQESNDDGRTWKPVLHILRISSVDGKEYEVRYQKTSN